MNRTAVAGPESTGSVSASGFTSPDELNTALAAKATAAGAGHYRITSVTGETKFPERLPCTIDNLYSVTATPGRLTVTGRSCL